MGDSSDSIKINHPKRQFFDDSLPEYLQLLVYSAGDLEIKLEKQFKPTNKVLRKSSSMHDIRYQTFRNDDHLPEDLRVILIKNLKELYKIYESMDGPFRQFYVKLLRFYMSNTWNFNVFSQIMSTLINFIDTCPKDILTKIFNLIAMMEFHIYLMKHNSQNRGDLRKFLYANFPFEAFNQEQKNINKEKEGMNLIDVDRYISGRERTSVSVNLNDGFNFRFMRKLTTEIKTTEAIELIRSKENVLANFASFMQDDRLIQENKVLLNESKIFNMWTIIFATHNQLKTIMDQKLKYLIQEKTCCRVCDTRMNRYTFIEHVRTCYQMRKKMLKIAEISDNIITRKKEFESLRRNFKLQIMYKHDDGFKQRLDQISMDELNQHKARLQRKTFYGGLNFTSTLLVSSGSKRTSKQIKEMKVDYQFIFKVSKGLKLFCHELEMGPLFTKSDLIVRRDLITGLKKVSGKYTQRICTLMRELNYCIDQRLVQIEKYLHLQKISDPSVKNQSRRGATMAGALNLSSENIFTKGEALDNTSSNNNQKVEDQVNSFNRKNTFAYNLDIFKVTRSDQEDSDCLADSDEELMMGMENIFNYSKKQFSSTTLDMASPKNKKDKDKEKEKQANVMDEPVSRRDWRKHQSNKSFYEDHSSLKDEFKTSETCTKSSQNENNNTQESKEENEDTSSMQGDTQVENHKKLMEDFGSMNIAMPISNTTLENGEQDSGIVFKLIPKRLDVITRSDSTNIERSSGDKEKKPKIPQKSNFGQVGTQKKSRLTNQVSLDIEIEIEPFKANNDDNRFSELDSPTKGAPRFFKNLVPVVEKKQDISSADSKLKMEWSSILKKIGTSFLKSVAANEAQQKQKNITKTFQKEHEDVVKRIDEDFDHLEDIERLTATDPGEYFKSNPTLLSKVNFVAISDFQYVKTLGAGAFGQVYLVRKKASGDYFAMKVIGSDQELSRNYIKNLLNEREVFSVINSEFCVNALATFTYKSLVCFVMEYLPGRDLYEEVFERETLWFDSSSIRCYIAEMILGIEALHQNGIVHRDIKPANVLIDEEGHIKLTDFGLSEFRSKIGTTTKDGKTMIKGSAQYLAPEIVRGVDAGYEVDWWALGVMVYLFINQDFPFSGDSVDQVMQNILKGDIDWSNVGEDEEEGQMNPDLADLVKKLLDPNPKTRLGTQGADSIKTHSYFKNLNWQHVQDKKSYMFPPQDILDLKMFTHQGIPMAEYLDSEFSNILEKTNTKSKANLAFSNRFELVRTDQFHRRNMKMRIQAKKVARDFHKEESQITNVIQDYCKREELYFYRNFNNF